MPALDGLLVVAVEHAVAAPFCSARLAQAGARVIKIERTDGDFARHYDSVVLGESAYFVWLNQRKESLVLNLKNSDDCELLYNLLEHADVFIQNLAPGAAGRLGLDNDRLARKYPRLITCGISGYGESGPYKDMKAYDLLVQCESGLASVTGSPGEPGRVGISICDIAAGMTAYHLILEALIERTNTGKGSTLDVSLFDSIADWMNVPYLHQVYTGKAPERIGIAHPSIAPYGAFETGDGDSLVIGIQNEREWRRFCDLVDSNAELAKDLRFKDNSSRVQNRAALDEAVASIIRNFNTAELTALLKTAAIAFASLRSVEEFSKHPQLKLQTVDTQQGPIELIAAPGRHKDVPVAMVPALGEHSETIRAEFSGNAKAANR